MLNQDSIIYNSLKDELRRNLQMQELSQSMLNTLPKGSLQSMVRGEKTYWYIKYRDGDKVIKKYIGEESKIDLEDFRGKINKRKKHEKILKKLIAEEKELRKILHIRGNSFLYI